MAVTERDQGSTCSFENSGGSCAGLKVPRSFWIILLITTAIALVTYFVAPISGGAQTPPKGKAKSVPVTGKDSNFESEVVKADIPVLVEFWATWCGPCKTMEPIVEAIAEEYAGKLKVVKVRVEDAPKAAARYKIEAIPSFLVIQRGVVKTQFVGARSKSKLADAIKPYLD